MDNDRRKIELMNSLLMSFPGTPIIYYGDEIGMGDNIYLGDRNGVRTPMQWASDRNGGFSRADPARLYAPMIMDPVYGYEAVNVEAQSRSLGSLLSATKKLIAIRKSTTAFGRGSMMFIRPENRSVLAYVRQYRDQAILCVANLSRSAQATELDLSAWTGRIPLEMLGRSRFPAIGELPYMITLGPYGFYWFELQPPDKSEPVRPRAVPEFETLVVPVGATWLSLARERGTFERDVLPGYLARTRWYPERAPRAIEPTLVAAIPFCDIGDNRPWLAFFEAKQRGETARYVLPMQIEWVRFDREHYNPRALAAVRQGAREGTLLDVATDPIFIGLMLRNLRERLSVDESEQGLELKFRPTSKFDDSMVRQPDRVRGFESEFPANSALVNHSFAFKLFRKLETGIHPAAEMGRFLTDVVGFANAPDLLGTAELIEPDDSRCLIATLHAQVPNQGDAWTVTAGYLDRLIEEQRLLQDGEGEEQAPLRQMAQIGKRLAELHLALASDTVENGFAPEPVLDADWRRWGNEIIDSAGRAIDILNLHRTSLAAGDRPLIEQLKMQTAPLRDWLARLPPRDLDLVAIRHHGSFALAQALIVKDDIFIIGFEGEAGRTIAQRRRKMPAARDIAGLIHSIDASAEAALQRALKVAADDQGRLAMRLGEWRDRSAEAFLAGYREVMTDVRLWPDDPWAAQRLVDFFLLEKALYEIEHEAAHRPDRLRFPLAAILRMLAKQPSSVR
jgi:maltose alpha-D-glucosyltransferase/alpha-amylase